MSSNVIKTMECRKENILLVWEAIFHFHPFFIKNLGIQEVYLTHIFLGTFHSFIYLLFVLFGLQRAQHHTTSCSQCPTVNEERQQLNWFSWPPQGYMHGPVPLHISLCSFWGFWGFWGFVVICQQILQTLRNPQCPVGNWTNCDHFCFYKKFTFLLHCVLQKSINFKWLENIMVSQYLPDRKWGSIFKYNFIDKKTCIHMYYGGLQWKRWCKHM